MALHRDIYWIGRQWAVTGFGLQAVNQKHGGEFDIAIENLWDDDPRIVLRGQKWFNPDDANWYIRMDIAFGVGVIDANRFVHVPSKES